MIGKQKQLIPTIAAKNRIIDNIIDAIIAHDHFLLLGHKHPDEDCISSLVGFALILSKFGKAPVIYLSQSMSRHHGFMIDICRYNSIQLVNSFDPGHHQVDVVVVIDTPKPELVDSNEGIEKLLLDEKVLKIEIDHHIGTDGAYNGYDGYNLVTEASSAAELVGHLAMKLNERKRLLRQHQITDLFSRNVVLSLLTGMIADSNMGQYLKSRRERRYYEIFSNMFNTMLTKETVKVGNFANMEEIFAELRHLSSNEEKCYRKMIGKQRRSKLIGYVVFNERESEELFRTQDYDTVVSVSRTVADRLADDSGGIGLVCYYDDQVHSEYVQFRVRRNSSFKGFDLRDLLTLLSIENGGGHEGAIGFRFPKSEIGNLNEYLRTILPKIEEALAATRA